MWSSSSLLFCLLAQVVISAPAYNVHQEIRTRDACHKYVLISSRGTGEPQGPSIGFKSMINQTFAAVPGGAEYDTVYPAAADNNEPVGAADIIRYISAGLQSCPSQTYGLLGYSQGATVVSDALGNLTNTASTAYSPAAVAAIKAVLVIGNPVHKAYQTANVDENGGKTTDKYTGSLVGFGGRTYIPASIYASGKLLDICFTNDAVCEGANVGSVATAGSSHFLYGFTASVQDEGAKFLIGKFV